MKPQKTIHVNGIGHIFVNTQNKTVNLCFSISESGEPEFVDVHKVFSPKKSSDMFEEAEENARYHTLIEKISGYFVMECAEDD